MGLEFMHSKQICHFDVKPHNIFINEAMCPKFADFGMSEYLKDMRSTKPGFTLLYCSPEQIKGDNPGPKSDIWSFGMCFYYILHLKNPFDYLETMRGHSLNKKEFYKELKKRSRRPRVDENFEHEYPRFISLMREMWIEDPGRRPTIKDVSFGLKKSIELLRPKNRY